MTLFTRRNPNKEFESFIRPHLADLYRLAYRLTGAREDAEDLVHDLVLKVYRGNRALRELENPRTWLSKVMYRMFVDEYRRTQRFPTQFLEETDDETQQDVEHRDAEHLNQQRQLIEQVSQALAQLSEEHRVMILMFEVEGYSLSEMQEILALPIGTLKSRLHRARNRLREILHQQGTFSEEASCKEQRV